MDLLRTEDQLLGYLGQYIRACAGSRMRARCSRRARYTLAIDSKKVGIFTRQELADGVNLARGNLGPIADQSLTVRAQIIDLAHLLCYRFKNTRPVAARQLPGSSDEDAAVSSTSGGASC